MSGVEAVAFLPAVNMPMLAPAMTPPEAPWDGGEVVPRGGAGPGESAFSRIFGEQVEALNAKLVGADRGLQELASGAPTSLHHLMMKLEDAKLSLQLVLQVRNRLLDAYSELARMQI